MEATFLLGVVRVRLFDFMARLSVSAADDYVVGSRAWRE
jgi:hypothetical protein